MNNIGKLRLLLILAFFFNTIIVSANPTNQQNVQSITFHFEFAKDTADLGIDQLLELMKLGSIEQQNISLGWLKSQSELGNKNAKLRLAYVLLDAGEIEAGLRLLHELSQQEHQEAKTRLSQIYPFDAVSEEQIRSNIVTLLDELKANNKSGFNNTSTSEITTYDSTENVSDIELLASGGDAEAAYRLSHRYETAKGVEQSKELACRWLAKSFLLGNIDSYQELIICINKFDLTGDGIESEEQVLTLAAESYGYNVPGFVGEHYFEGVGVTKDYKRARQYFEKAVLQGDTLSAHFLGRIYRDGLGTEPDDVEAFSYFKQAAEAGETVAKYALAMAYWKGRGIQVDHRQAFNWMQSSAYDMGLSESQYQYAVMLSTGFDGEEKMLEALQWMQVARRAGDAKASCFLEVVWDTQNLAKSQDEIVEQALDLCSSQ